MSPRADAIIFETDPAHLDHPVLAFLKSYWEAKRGARPFPARADIKPAEMKEHLGWVILIDVLPDEFRFRTIGSRVTEYFLKDSTGKTMREAFAPLGETAVACVLAMHRQCAQERVALRVHGGADWLGQSSFDFDTLCLPLSDDGEQVNMILCGLTFGLAENLKSKG
jgi:hypothetical protein